MLAYNHLSFFSQEGFVFGSFMAFSLQVRNCIVLDTNSMLPWSLNSSSI